MAASAPPSKPPRGALIVFEGVDRCGKTTQTGLLVDALRDAGVHAELWRFPDRTTAIGKMINGYLASEVEVDDASIHLLFAANRWEKRSAMLAALRGGTTLVVDRYSYSGVAFTAAKGAQGLDLAWCSAPEVGLPAPDAVIYLSMDVEAAAARGGFGEERYETLDMQRAVRAQFAAMKGEGWAELDAAQDVPTVAAQAREVAMAAVEAARGGAPLTTLWSRQPLLE